MTDNAQDTDTTDTPNEEHDPSTLAACGGEAGNHVCALTVHETDVPDDGAAALIHQCECGQRWSVDPNGSIRGHGGGAVGNLLDGLVAGVRQMLGLSDDDDDSDSSDSGDSSNDGEPDTLRTDDLGVGVYYVDYSGNIFRLADPGFDARTSLPQPVIAGLTRGHIGGFDEAATLCSMLSVAKWRADSIRESMPVGTAESG